MSGDPYVRFAFSSGRSGERKRFLWRGFRPILYISP